MSTIYARMEEISFRSGAAVAAGAVAAAGTAIALPMVLAGHSAAAISAPVPSATVRITGPTTGRSAPPSPVLPTASPSARAQATAVASLMPAGAYQPPVPVTAVTTRRASAAPAAGLPTPRLTRPPVDPRYHAPFRWSPPWSPPWRWSPPWGWNPSWP